MKIEIELNTLDQWLIGINKLNAEVQNKITGAFIENMNCIQIGLLFFNIVIYFEK